MAKNKAMSGNKTFLYISLPLEGRFKARPQEIQRCIIDAAWGKSSGTQPGLWAVQLINTLEKCGVRDSWTFQRSGKQIRMSEFRMSLFDMLL